MQALRYAVGDQVEDGAVLVEFAETADMSLPARVKIVEVGPRDGLAERAAACSRRRPRSS